MGKSGSAQEQYATLCADAFKPCTIGLAWFRLDLVQQTAPADEAGRLRRKFANAGSIGGGHAVSLGWVLGAPPRTVMESYCFEDAIQLAI